VATDEVFTSSPQSGLTWLCFLFAGWGSGADRASRVNRVGVVPTVSMAYSQIPPLFRHRKREHVTPLLRQSRAFRERDAYLRESCSDDILIYSVAINAWDWLDDDFPAVLRWALV